LILLAAVVFVLAATSLLLVGFGINLLYLTWRATRLRPREQPEAGRGDELSVCVQIPVYNERYVAERVIEAVCGIEWPRARFEVQVLDDSDDDTVAIVAARVSRWSRRGTSITHVRRGTREGFKAGALAYGMTQTQAPFLAIFDADFVPPADFLRRTMGVFADGRVGFVQARWGHLDEGYSWFTRLQALAIDFHFLVEQAVRSAHGYFTNFTGTAGVWRRAAIEDAGGWSAATLTEDLDLSYRAQLRGWHAAYLEDLVVPEELPVSIDPYRRQQSRWATGSFQAAFTLLGPVLRSDNHFAVKLQAVIHLLAYSVGPLMLLQLLCYPTLLIAQPAGVPWQLPTVAIWINLIGVSPWVGFMVAQTRRGRPWWSGAAALMCQVIGAGMSFTVFCALARATRRGGVFVRTPKYRIVRRGQEWRDQAYVRLGDPRVIGEAFLGIGAASLVPVALTTGHGLIGLYSSVFAIGFLSLATLSALEVLQVFALRNLGRRAVARARRALPVVCLLGVTAILLLTATLMPMPFEDGYAHWLMAASLAATGHLHDPLFGMEDTWLPGYQLVAAAVLKVFGLWSINALRGFGVIAGVATLALTYALAPSRRQGVLAVALLALNPVFLFTTSVTVAEPLMTTLLCGAGLAAVRSRTRVAMVLALAACAVSTKAWIFAGVAGAAVLLPSLLRGEGWVVGRVQALRAGVFALPVLGLLAVPFAWNSLARGAQEVVSATARGSLPSSGAARASELAGTFALAALPLVAAGAAGLVIAVRNRSPLLRLVYIPAVVYLGAVVVLVAAGGYSGSQRYLYPALPALALLAAGALDRQPAAARLMAAAATVLLAVGFIPVFAGFATGNSGLIAAGRSAAGSPGVLVTDSPVVAYFSHKPPGEITGSQSLPPDREAAVAWMRAHGVTDVVTENIDYYRATQLFPDLAAGTATPPFEPLGDQSYYQAAGGKTVYAYRLGEGLDQQAVFPGVDVVIRPAPAEGKSAPLAKGATLVIGGSSAAGEGMGFGVPIVHYPDGWIFPRTETVTDLSSGGAAIWRVVYDLNETGGDAVGGGGFDFTPTYSRGLIAVTYTVDASGITVVVQPIQLDPGYSQVGILNEESGGFDNFADQSQTLIGPALGSWVPVSGDWARMRSASLGVEWSVPMIPGAQLYGGREVRAPSFNWAGLDYVFTGPFSGATYRIDVQQAR
jgi:cellulose synthase/poly-beta-1,6-N-acetylglucosamine synthase-like glycosyltransferase